MTATQNIQTKEQALAKIINNDLKKKKWDKASKWLKEQMIQWEIEKN
ncbi:hypothetical protein [Flammeovirga kamogawensis]|uniref:Uncharacterized protein n=1 Tax=Flammeovirga kamogawensis TaxID=373891 RepID=A0ABX8GQ62_9BACT|nr:hypothetical protein [Flammeovirga kamogawensis]MBB6463095.1 hypothetical protein [Flammeovirga kamogawensis]QWG05728.1 hypothetical protein KM029_10065 [Flammeovirga kamogawensis]